jgi:hypothetical protein
MKRIEHMSLWEKAYFPEIVRGVSVTGYHFWRNLSIHFLQLFGLAKNLQASVTVQYPEQRTSYPDSFRARRMDNTKTNKLGDEHGDISKTTEGVST